MSGNLINGKTANDQLFPGKIAVVTGSTSNEDDFYSAKQLVAKYGNDKIIHVIWPQNFLAHQNKIIDIGSALATDVEIKALIINQALPGTNAAVDKFKETRDDVLIIYCTSHEAIEEVTARANLILEPNELDMGPAMVKQARKQGAKVFVHYSFERHMSQPILSGCFRLIQDACAAEDIKLVYAAALDPAGEAGIAGARQFILEDVPKLVAKYGEDTAFYCTNCALQASLIRAVVDSHAIYPQPCCPSPFHGFPDALGINTDGDHSDLNHIINEACRIAAEKNMTDRLSTWPVSASMMFMNAGAKYAIKWIKGLVPKTDIDDRVLEYCMNEYVKEVVGEGVEVEMVSRTENGTTYDNFKLLLMSYLDF